MGGGGVSLVGWVGVACALCAACIEGRVSPEKYCTAIMCMRGSYWSQEYGDLGVEISIGSRSRTRMYLILLHSSEANFFLPILSIFVPFLDLRQIV